MSDPFALETMEPFVDRTILRNGSLVLASSVFLRHRVVLAYRRQGDSATKPEEVL